MDSVGSYRSMIPGVSPSMPTSTHTSRNARVVHKVSNTEVTPRGMEVEDFNCGSKDKKIQKECWRMREVHIDKMRELEMDWLKSTRSISLVEEERGHTSGPRAVSEDSPSEENDADAYPMQIDSMYDIPTETAEVYSVDVISQKNCSEVFVRRVNANEAFCMPTTTSKPPVKVGSFTSLTRKKSRKLKKEIRRMKSLVKDELVKTSESERTMGVHVSNVESQFMKYGSIRNVTKF